MRKRIVFLLVGMLMTASQATVRAAPATAPAPVSTAGPELIDANDPRGVDVRAAAEQFWFAVGAGDVAKAKSLFAGKPDHAGLIDAYAKYFEAYEELTKAVQARVNEIPQAKPFLDPRRSPRLLARAQATPTMIVSGDRAWIAGMGEQFRGTRLEKTEGAWEIIALAPTDTRAKQLNTFIDASTRWFHRCAEAANSRKDNDPAIAKAGYEEITKARMAAMEKVGTPECDAITPPADAQLASGDTLTALLGKSIASDEVRALIRSLPGLPRVSNFQTNVGIDSDETGVSMVFDGPAASQKLIQINFAVIDSDVSRAYRGKLPAGLRSDLRRREVERHLGAPESSAGGTGRMRYLAEYMSRGVAIDYAEADARDPDNRLREIMVRPPVSVANPATRPIPNLPRVAFRLVEENPRPGDAGVETLEMIAPAGETPAHYAVRREVLLDERAIATIVPNRDVNTGERIVAITMTSEGSKLLEKATGENVNRMLAIVLDGKVLIAPTVRGVISTGLQLNLGKGHDSFEDQHEILGRLHAAVNTLPPATRPASSPSPP